VFLEDGRVEMDTNVVERAIRPNTLTRKNALFAYSVDPDQPFRPIVITESGDPDHGVHPA
jgi:hypothetical protein